MTPSTVLVTGARGKTGREVVVRLAGRGITVRAGTRIPGPVTDGVRPVPFDWEDPTTWRDAAAGADAVYLMRPDLPDAPKLVADLVRVLPEAHVVLLSEQGAEETPPDSWVAGVEHAVTSAAASWTIVRPSWFQQVFVDERFYLDAIREQGVLRISSAGAPLAWVDARDIAAVVARALLEPERYAGGSLTVTGPEALTVAAVADLVAEAAGRPVRADDPSVADSVAGLDAWLAEVYGDVLERTRSGGFGDVTGVVRAVTGHEARSVADFVREHADLWRPGGR